MKTQFVNQLKNNDQVDDYFVLANVGQRPYRDTSKGNFLQLIIQDKTGTVPAKFWSEKDQTKTIAEFLSDAQVIKILGKVDDYQGNLSIVLTEPPEKVTDYDTPEDFLVKTDKDIPQMLQSLKDEISNISNPHIKQLLELFSNDEKFMEKFSRSPAA